ncbi:hypothetical protein ACFQBY_13380 [Promicromonospora citrea]|uniref:DUF4386 family protein n=3 Tax=Promicromonospora citrea TaxID=43677 RepID=A0A8H9GJD8_9MICO|nr:hypothetical protein [Promicromonospora citrea]GGM31365.1 hypothetical protein GCM10010102_28420 [Promicromonospora citrea]
MTAGRWTTVGFVAAGLSFLLFPLLRPWPDETVATPELAAGFASGRWVVAHLAGILGLGLLAPALLGLRAVLAARGAGGVRAATGALVAAWAGAGFAALYFGAEIFGLRTLAQAALRDGDPVPLADVEALRLQPGAVALFGAGLLLLAVAGVLLAVALWQAGPGARWAGVPLAVGLVLVLPQFFGGPGLRIAHGVLVAAGCVLVAAVLQRARR